MFSKIQNPETGNWVNTNGIVGRRVLRNYLKQLGGAGARISINMGGLSIDTGCGDGFAPGIAGSGAYYKPPTHCPPFFKCNLNAKITPDGDPTWDRDDEGASTHGGEEGEEGEEEVGATPDTVATAAAAAATPDTVATAAAAAAAAGGEEEGGEEKKSLTVKKLGHGAFGSVYLIQGNSQELINEDKGNLTLELNKSKYEFQIFERIDIADDLPVPDPIAFKHLYFISPPQQYFSDAAKEKRETRVFLFVPPIRDPWPILGFEDIPVPNTVRLDRELQTDTEFQTDISRLLLKTAAEMHKDEWESMLNQLLNTKRTHYSNINSLKQDNPFLIETYTLFLCMRITSCSTRYDYGIFSEYVEGTDLGEYLKSDTGDDILKVLYIFQAITILDKMFQMKIYHNDFKPDNIRIDNKTKYLRVIDYDLITVGGPRDQDRRPPKDTSGEYPIRDMLYFLRKIKIIIKDIPSIKYIIPIIGQILNEKYDSLHFTEVASYQDLNIDNIDDNQFREALLEMTENGCRRCAESISVESSDSLEGEHPPAKRARVVPEAPDGEEDGGGGSSGAGIKKSDQGLNIRFENLYHSIQSIIQAHLRATAGVSPATVLLDVGEDGSGPVK